MEQVAFTTVTYLAWPLFICSSDRDKRFRGITYYKSYKSVCPENSALWSLLGHKSHGNTLSFDLMMHFYILYFLYKFGKTSVYYACLDLFVHLNNLKNKKIFFLCCANIYLKKLKKII